MVYRGKPSAGCENCRKAKKRCTLEQPACARCVKLKKDCVGYRDTSQLQIQDETQHVTQKAEKRRVQLATPALTPAPNPGTRGAPGRSQWPVQRPTPAFSQPHMVEDSSLGASSGVPPASIMPFSPRPCSPFNFMATPGTVNSDSSSGSSDGTIEMMPMEDILTMSELDRNQGWNFNNPSDIEFPYWFTNVPPTLSPAPEELAINYFLTRFGATGHWSYVAKYASLAGRDPTLSLAIKACGMAALSNVQHIPHGREWSRGMYVEALGLLNAALRDPKRSKTDQSLIAVTLLSFYENLCCDSRESIQSWKAHILGATQLLKLRGKAQFKSEIGRTIFRETRAQIFINCIWDDAMPPEFLRDWQEELEAQTVLVDIIRPADQLVGMSFDFASLRAKIRYNSINMTDALNLANDIERRMIQWAVDTSASNERWRYYNLQVDDSPHVWNGMVHSYTGVPAPGVWNIYRVMRIILSRTQELLSRRFVLSVEERSAQHAYFRSVRRQLTNDICGCIPVQLGHAAPAYSSQSVMITAYNSIWPLFFAGTCALERIGESMWDKDPRAQGGPEFTAAAVSSAAAAQAQWIIGRLDFISREVGLHWAQGIASTLKGDFTIDTELLPENDPLEVQAAAAEKRNDEGIHVFPEKKDRAKLVDRLAQEESVRPVKPLAVLQEMQRQARAAETKKAIKQNPTAHMYDDNLMAEELRGKW